MLAEVYMYQTGTTKHLLKSTSILLIDLFIHLLLRADYVPGTVNKQLGREIGQRSAHLELIPRGEKTLITETYTKLK